MAAHALQATWVGMIFCGSFVPVEPAAVRAAEDVAAAGGACMGPAIPSTQFCVCPQTLPACFGSQCSSGKHVASQTPVQGYRRGCADCSCRASETDSPGVGTDSSGSSTSSDHDPVDWERCANEGDTAGCACNGLVRFGRPGSWAVSVSSGTVQCSGRFLRSAAGSGGDVGQTQRECQCKPGFPAGMLSRTFPGAWKDGRPRLLIFTVATHREPFIDLTERSVEALGNQFKLHVVGIGEEFRGYGWKLKAVRKYLLAHRDHYDIVLFTDSFDSYVLSDPEEIVDKFLSFEAPMIVSAEVNIWPNPHLAEFMPPSASTGHYPFPNSGGYMGFLDYVLELYTETIRIQAKSDCVDDQGELIKAVAQNHSAFVIDHQAVIFQTLFGKAKSDLEVVDGRPVNTATGTRPCVVHANGWDKQPLLALLERCGLLEDTGLLEAVKARRETLEKTRTLQTREKGINERCAMSNPNPGLDPDDNTIKNHHLMSKYTLLKTRLERAETPWHVVEQQTWEIQEYLGHCPIQSSVDAGSFVIPDSSAADGFRIYVYPLSDARVAALPAIYRAIRESMMASPYRTLDPSEASVFIPSVDTSCWCEACLGDRPFREMSPQSIGVSEALTQLAHWNGGRNHVLFEFSDAPCLPYLAGNAVIAKVGLSTFHHRADHDVSMPLFAMVEWNRTARRTPVGDRKFLLTFRGTRSPGSDQTRKHLWKLHNEEAGIFVACACRWFDAAKGSSKGNGYDERCRADEATFEQHTYTELMLGTRFSLIVEGFGYHSFRLTEVLAAGAIPVIAVDHYVLPFQSILDWDQFSIRIPEDRILDLPAILKAIPESRVFEMQRQAVQVYETFLGSLDAQLATAVEQIRIEHFEPEADRDAYRAALNRDGLPSKISATLTSTAADVQRASMSCNAPQHRREKARDGAVMR